MCRIFGCVCQRVAKVHRHNRTKLLNTAWDLINSDDNPLNLNSFNEAIQWIGVLCVLFLIFMPFFWAFFGLFLFNVLSTNKKKTKKKNMI